MLSARRIPLSRAAEAELSGWLPLNRTMVALLIPVALLALLRHGIAATPDRFVELWGEENVIDGVDCDLDEDTHVCPTRDDDSGAVPPANECCVPTHLPRGMDPSLATCGGTRPTGLPFAGRSPVYAQHGMAATSVPLSTMCAIDILKAGGSAVDAAIAANACENVVEPMMNGMGGDLMAQVFHGPSKTLHGYNGAGRSPMGLSYEKMEAYVKAMGSKTIPGSGPLGVSVPGAVKGWCDLHEKFGKLDWPRIFEPAITYAEDGHPVAQVIAAEWVSRVPGCRLSLVLSKGIRALTPILRIVRFLTRSTSHGTPPPSPRAASFRTPWTGFSRPSRCRTAAAPVAAARHAQERSSRTQRSQ
jgi:hypothetical protein